MQSVKCPSCGLVDFATSICKRCQHRLTDDQLTDEKTVNSIKAAQHLVLGIGCLISFVLSFSVIFIIEDAVQMAVSFVGIIAAGLIVSWVISSMIERRMLGGKKLRYKITGAEKGSVFAASLFVAYIVFVNAGVGYFLAPIIIVFFNGAIYLYERQMNIRASNC